MDQPNILWITLDSVRSDHTSLDGYERDTTPVLADIARSDIGFRNCFAHSKSTQPSSGAILTGFAPTRTRLGIDRNTLPASIPTVAERFSDAGYTTACLSRNSFVSSATGLDRGFDRQQWLSSSTIHEAGFRTLFKYLLNISEHSAGLTLDTARHASPFLMNEVAKRWLRDFEAGEDPFFCYLHYNEPHRPYCPPGKFLDTYTDDLDMSGKEASDIALDIHYNLNEIVATGCELTDREWEAMIAMYDAEIAYTDSMVGQLLSYLDSLDLSDTVVVVTSDHGELFGEYGLLAHSYVLTDAVTRVPLAIRGLDADLAVDEDSIVQHSDVMTTLLSIAGVDASDTIGVDLREEVREFAVSQRNPADLDAIFEHNPSFDASPFLSGETTSIRTETHRYQTDQTDEQLFELPDEQTDIHDEDPELTEELSAKLDAWLDRYGTPVDEMDDDTEFSGAVKRQLSDLGYLD